MTAGGQMWYADAEQTDRQTNKGDKPNMIIDNLIVRPRMDVHVVPVAGLGGLWALKMETLPNYSGTYNTKAEAVGYGIGLAREMAVSLVVHGKNGRIQAVWSYLQLDTPRIMDSSKETI